MTFFHDIWTVLKREFDRIRKFPIYPTLMVILPVISLLFFASIFSKGVPRDIPIAVIDDDNTSLSRTMVGMFDDTPSATVAYKIQDIAEGERLMKQGRISAIVQIPENFEKDILSNTRTHVTAYLSGLNLTANGMLNKDLQQAATTFSTGITIQVLMRQGLSEEQAYAQAMPLYFNKHILFNPYTNYGYYLLPSFMPMMIMIFTLMLTIFAIGSELKNGTAGEWMESTRGKAWPALIGKLIPVTTAMFLMVLFMNTIMYKWIGVPLNGNITVMTLAGFMFVLAYQSIGVLIISLLSNLRLSLSIGGGYSVLAFTFSGLTFPLMAMDPILQVLSYIFPFTVYTEVFIDQALRGAPLLNSFVHMGILSLYILLPLLCMPRLKRVATDEKYWGRM